MTRTIAFRRKREGKTDYRKRLKLLVSEKPRIVIRRSLNNIIVQIVEYNGDGDKVIAGVSSRALLKFGFKGHRGNKKAAYLSGLLAGKKASEKGVKECIADIGIVRSTKGSRIYAAVKGIIDSGLSIKCSEEALPKSIDGIEDIKSKIMGGK